MIMFLKSHSVSVGFSSSSSSSSSGLVQQSRQDGGGVMAGINKQSNRAGVPAPVIPNNPAPLIQVQEGTNVVDPAAAADAAAAAAAARKKKKKEKKKAAISLFEFPGDEEKPAKKNNKSKAEKD
jgi:hypothetical protein